MDFTIYAESEEEAFIASTDLENIEINSDLKKKPSKASEITQFWQVMESERFDLKKSAYLKEVALVQYGAPNFVVNFYNKSVLQEQSKAIYDDISYVLYDIYDTSCQKRNYNCSIKELDVEAIMFDLEEDSPRTQALDEIPWEYDTIPLFLYRIFCKVCNNMDDPFSENGLDNGAQSDGNHQNSTVDATMNQETSWLDAEDAGSILRSSIFNPQMEILKDIKHKIIDRMTLLNNYHGICDDQTNVCETSVDGPTLLKYGNDIDFTSVKLNNDDIFIGHIEMTRLLVFSLLCTKFPDPDLGSQLKYRYHIDKLHHSVPDKVLYPDVIRRLLNILVFDHIAFDENNRSVERTKWRRKGCMRYTDLLKTNSCPTFNAFQGASEASNDLFPNKSDLKVNYDPQLDIFECPEIAHLIDDYDILVFREGPTALFKYMNGYTYTEPLIYDVLVQTLVKSYAKFDAVDFEYYPPSDSILVRFSNPNKIAVVDIFCERLLSKICMRDFFDYILDEEQRWLEIQEEEHDRNLFKLKRTMQEIPEEMQIEEDLTCLSRDLLVEGSIKHNNELQKQGLINSTTLESTTADIKSGLKSETIGKKKDKNNKKTDEINIKTKNETQDENSTFNFLVNDTNINSEEENFSFLGYDLGDTRTQVNGKFITFYGVKCKIRAKFLEWIYHGKLMSIEIIMKDSSLFYHCPLGPLYKEYGNNYHLILRNNIIIAFANILNDGIPEKGVSNEEMPYNEDEIKVQTNFKNMNTSETESNATSENAQEEEGDQDELEVLYPLDISIQCSWPNGLSIDFVEQQREPFFIRQTMSQQQFTKMPCDNTENRTSMTSNTKIQNTCVDFPITKPEFLIQYRKEHHRIFTRRGTVVVFNEDESVLLHTPYGAQFWLASEDVKLCSNRYSVYYKEFDDYLYVSPMGHQAVVRGKEETTADDLLFRCAHDYLRSEVFMRRADGTNMFLNSETLIVSYDDGTRIMSTSFIDDSYVYIRLNGNEYRSSLDYDYNSLSESSFKSGYISNTAYEPWSTVSIIYRIDHPDYATIYYDESMYATLLMPGNIKLNVAFNGHCTVEMEKTFLNVTSREVTMRSSICSNCHSASKATLFFSNYRTDSDIPRYILKAKDCYDKKFYVTNEGKCLWDKKSSMEDINRKESLKPCCKAINPNDMENLFIIRRNYEGK